MTNKHSIMRNGIGKIRTAIVVVALLLGSIRGALAENSQQVTTTEGNDFFVTWLLNGASWVLPTPDPDLALTLIASARQATTIVLEYASGATKNFPIPANGAVSIPIDPNSVYVDLGASQTEQVLAKGVRVYSKDPKNRFTLIATNKNGSNKATSFDVTMIVPTEGLGQEYIIQTHENDDVASEFAIIGTDTATNITIKLPEDVSTTKRTKGEEFSITLGPKDIWLATAAEADFDLSGTIICADKPIAVFQGHRNAIIPKEQALSSDHAVEQALPVERWGKEFVVPMLGGNLKEVYVEMTAGFDDTNISIQGGNDRLIQSSVSLSRGKTYRGRLREGALYITANKPIEIYLYSTSGGYNTYEDEDFNQHRLGDPSSTIVNSVEQFVDTTIYTPYTLGGGGSELAHYINIVTRDPSEMKLNGENISTDFQSADGGLYYATKSVSAGTHTLTNPKGFTGFAYGLNDGQMYLHSVGYKFVPFADSLFVTTYNVMSPTYMEEMDSLDQGYYQRQWKEWPIGEGRWDTAIVCDGTEIEFLGQVATDYIPRNEIKWEVYQIDFKTGDVLPNPIKTEPISPADLDKSLHPWKYLFEVEDQDDMNPELRDPYTDYQVNFEISRDHNTCTELDHSLDTLHMVVRVLRAYNDTSTHVVCIGDTLRFFKDTGIEENGFYKRAINEEGEDSTSFVSKASNPLFDIQYTKNEWLYYTRQYETESGCDSIMTLRLYVCDTFRTVIDTTICENEILQFTQDKFIGRKFCQIPNTDSVYFDTLKTKGCGCLDSVPDFRGCDSIIELHVHVCPIFRDTIQDTLCVNGNFNIPYSWHRKDNSYVKDVYLTNTNVGKTTFFSDTLRTTNCSNCAKGSCDSIFVLRLYIPNYVHDTLSDHFCDAHYDKTTHTRITNSYSWTKHEGHTVWDSKNKTRISADNIDQMSIGTNIFIDSMKTVYGCDSIFELHLTKHEMFFQMDEKHIPSNAVCEWHGRTYGPFPNVPEGTEKIFYDEKATTTQTGCDSIWGLKLIISASFFETDIQTFCDNEINSFTWKGHKCGHKKDTTIRIIPDEKKHVYEIVDSLKTKGTPVPCDSVWKLILTINPTYERFDTIHLCDNQVVTWNKFKYAGSKAVEGDYRIKFSEASTAVYGYDDKENLGTTCDSICHVHFFVHKTYEKRDKDVVICADSNFVWQGHSDKGHKIYDQETGKVITFGKGKLWKNNTNATFILEDRMKTETCSECPDHIGCDSIHILKLTIYPVYGPKVIDTTYCLSNGLPFQWRPDANNPNHVINLYRDTTKCYDTLHTVNCGCDSIYELRLRIYDNTLKDANTIYLNNCDSIDHKHNRVWYEHLNNGIGGYLPNPHVETITHIHYFDTLHIAGCKCDSFVHLDYTIFPTYYNETKDHQCSDSVYVWNEEDFKNGKVYRNGKRVTKLTTNLPEGVTADTLVYIDSLTSTHGCDSIEVLKLFVTRSYAFYDTLKISNEGRLDWHGRIYVGELYKGAKPNSAIVVKGDLQDEVNIFTKPIKGYRCDSIYFLTLKWGKVYRDTTYDFVCDNCTYDWHIKSSVTGKDVVPDNAKGLKVAAGKDTTIYHECKTYMGFDSIYVLQLKGYPTYHYETSDTVCQGTKVDWAEHDGSEWLYQDGKKVDSISTSKFGWSKIEDRLPTQTMFIDPHNERTRVSACDSIYVRNLYISPIYDEVYNTDTTTDIESMCSNHTFVWDSVLYVGDNYDSLANPIAYPPMPGLDYKQVIHIKDVTLSNDTLYDLHPYTTYLGCDSTRFLNLYISHSPRVQVYDTIGDNNTKWHFGHGDNYHDAFEFHVEDYTDTTRVPYTVFFIDTLTSSQGCDSIVWDSLCILPSYKYTLDTTICSNIRFDWRRWTELNHTHSQTLSDTILSKYGTDEIYELNMTLIPSFREDSHINLCKNDTIQWQKETIFYSLGQIDGTIEYWEFYERQDTRCDSIYHLSVDYFDYYHYTSPDLIRTETICQYDDWHWIESDGSEHTQALYDQFGNHYTSIPTDTTGLVILYDSLHTSAPCHCDSIFELHLYVKPAFRSYNIDNVICSNDSIYWEQTGRYYTSDHGEDIYDTMTYVNAYGCDSMYYFHVRVNPHYENMLTETICADGGDYVWQNTSYADKIQAVATADQPTIIRDIRTYTAVGGCDSIYRLELTVLPINIDEWYDTICSSDTLHFNDKILKSTGTYRDTLVNQYGCNHYQTLHLTMIPPTHFSIGEPMICADDSRFELPYSPLGKMPIAYSIIFDSMALAQGFENDYHVYIPNNDTILSIAMPYYSSPTEYTRPDHYSATLYFDNGICRDSTLMRFEFSFEPRYPSWIIEQHWNDQIAILNSNLNGGYEFSSYQWYCEDTMLVGETKPYLYQPHWLDRTAHYYVELTRPGDTHAYKTCPIVPQWRAQDPVTPTMPYISVVPTVVVKENPVVNILSINPGTYKLYSGSGHLIESGDILPDEHHAMEVRLPSVSGVYVFSLSETSGLSRSIKVIVE